MTLLPRCQIVTRHISTPNAAPMRRVAAISHASYRQQPLQMPRPFSTSPAQLARKKQTHKKDPRITLIQYHLLHPLTPRPLRFSRNRSLRHWTIHRAYQLFRAKQRTAQEKELERQFQSMQQACEALRLMGEDGLAISEGGKAVPPPGARDPQFVVVDAETGHVEGPTAGRGKSGHAGVAGKEKKREHIDLKAAAEQQKEVGRLYRTAMLKSGIYDGVPIEYARMQTETPPRNGWDHGWTRQ